MKENIIDEAVYVYKYTIKYIYAYKYAFICTIFKIYITCTSFKQAKRTFPVGVTTENTVD